MELVAYPDKNIQIQIYIHIEKWHFIINNAIGFSQYLCPGVGILTPRQNSIRSRAHKLASPVSGTSGSARRRLTRAQRNTSACLSREKPRHVAVCVPVCMCVRAPAMQAKGVLSPLTSAPPNALSLQSLIGGVFH